MCSSIVARLGRPIVDSARTAAVVDPSLRTAAVHGLESLDTDQAYSSADWGWEMLAECTGALVRVADAAR